MYRLEPELFDLNYTLDCGQVFRWERDGDWWTGVVGENVVRLLQEKESGSLLVDSELSPEFFSHYFRLDDNLPSIYESINRDLLIDRAINRYRGLRLIRQDPWECLISYMLATASSIPTIQKRIFLLSRFFSDRNSKTDISAFRILKLLQTRICLCLTGVSSVSGQNA
nr:8-oxoguanine DNA glycosylase, N-terminal domain-containing protein [Methanosarcina horonobensis]